MHSINSVSHNKNHNHSSENTLRTAPGRPSKQRRSPTLSRRELRRIVAQMIG